jgi:hypothetical protein
MRSVNLTGRFSPKPDRGGFCFSSPHLINRREFVDICIVEGRNRGYHRVDTPAAVPNQVWLPTSTELFLWISLQVETLEA